MKPIIYAANAGDRNDRGMLGAIALGELIASRLAVEAQTVAQPVELVEGGWADQLRAATPNLRVLAREFGKRLEHDEHVLLTMGRCAASIATLPLAARRYPDAAIVWFDAHGDCNVPIGGRASDMNYLGGMVLTGAAGEWDTGFGDGVNLANVILVGARDLDPPEQDRIDAGHISHVPVGSRLGERLRDAIGGRRVYIHLDCDVMDAGLLATEYQSPAGLSFLELADAFDKLAEHDVLGLEIAEYEARWPDGRPNDPDHLVRSVWSVVAKLRR